MPKQFERLEFPSEPGEWASIWLNPPDLYRKMALRLGTPQQAAVSAKDKPDRSYTEAIQDSLEVGFRWADDVWQQIYFPLIEKWSLTDVETGAALPLDVSALDRISLAVKQHIQIRLQEIILNKPLGLGETNGASSTATSPNGTAPQNVVS